MELLDELLELQKDFIFEVNLHKKWADHDPMTIQDIEEANNDIICALLDYVEDQVLISNLN